MPKQPPRVWVVFDAEDGIPLDVFVTRKLADECAAEWRDVSEDDGREVVVAPYARVEPPRRKGTR
jgi:hypothetical protein